jgi:hypothetical protein
MYLTNIFMKNFNLKTLTSYFMIVLLGFAILSCKDDETPKEEETNPIVGSWKLTEIAPEKAGAVIPQLTILGNIGCLYDLVFTFQANNKFTPSNCDTAILLMQSLLPIGADTKWTVANNKLALENGTSKQEFAITQDANDLSIIVPIDPTNSDLNVKMKLVRLP